MKTQSENDLICIQQALEDLAGRQGYQSAAVDALDRLRGERDRLEARLAQSCDEGRGDPEHPVCSRAAAAEARIAELEQSRNSWHKLADEFEIQQDHYRLTLEHLRAAIRDHGTCAGTLMVNPGQGHGIVTADDFIANSLEIFN